MNKKFLIEVEINISDHEDALDLCKTDIKNIILGLLYDMESLYNNNIYFEENTFKIKEL